MREIPNTFSSAMDSGSDSPYFLSGRSRQQHCGLSHRSTTSPRSTRHPQLAHRISMLASVSPALGRSITPYMKVRGRSSGTLALLAGCWSDGARRSEGDGRGARLATGGPPSHRQRVVCLRGRCFVRRARRPFGWSPLRRRSRYASASSCVISPASIADGMCSPA